MTALTEIVVEVRVDDLEGRDEFGLIDVRYPIVYPKDFYWLFSGCDEEWGNNHRLCPADVRLRKGFRGHCVCGCHR